MDQVVLALLATITPDNLSNDTLLALNLVFSQQVLTAALDLVESSAVTRWTSTWGRTLHHTVAGTQMYIVTSLTSPAPQNTSAPVSDGPDVTDDSEWKPHTHQALTSFCTCPAFAHTILLAAAGSDSIPLMCKHMLAVLIAERMDRVLEHTAKDDEDFERLASFL